MHNTLRPEVIRLFQLATEREALLLGGAYKTKAGRLSPYFFNAGKLIEESRSLRSLSEIYGQAVRDSGVEFDGLFGPAYKGIPLVTMLALDMGKHLLSCGLTFNRKEAKDHGEGGLLVGASMKGKRILVVDDVISAGTAFKEASEFVQKSNGEVAGLVIALDRQETMVDPDTKVVSEMSAVQEVEKQGIPVIKVATLDDLVTYIRWADLAKAEEYIAAINAYRAQYGPKNQGPTAALAAA